MWVFVCMFVSKSTLVHNTLVLFVKVLSKFCVLSTVMILFCEYCSTVKCLVILFLLYTECPSRK